MSDNGLPIIAAVNQLPDATLTPSTEAANYPVENLADARPSVQWKGTGTAEQTVEIEFAAPVAITCVGIAGHDLKTQAAANLDFEYWNPGTSTWISCLSAAFTPASDKALLKTFTAKTYAKFRLKIPTGYTAAPSIGVLFVGAYVQFERWPRGPFAPRPRTVTARENRAVNGNFLGAGTTNKSRRLSLSFSGYSITHFESTIEPLLDVLEDGAPFFWAWEPVNHPLDVFYLALEPGDISPQLSANSYSFDLRLRGPKE